MKNVYDKIIDTQKNVKANEKALADFRKLSNLDKYLECQHYGTIISSTDIVTADGYLTTRIMSIYGKNFLFFLLSGEVINCYELQ